MSTDVPKELELGSSSLARARDERGIGAELSEILASWKSPSRSVGWGGMEVYAYGVFASRFVKLSACMKAYAKDAWFTALTNTCLD
jgi:hypothetical protein